MQVKQKTKVAVARFTKKNLIVGAEFGNGEFTKMRFKGHFEFVFCGADLFVGSTTDEASDFVSTISP